MEEALNLSSDRLLDDDGHVKILVYQQHVKLTRVMDSATYVRNNYAAQTRVYC